MHWYINVISWSCMSHHPGLHNGDQPWALFPMAPPKPTKLSSFLTERVSLLAENRSFSNILRRSYFSTGHLRQYMSADLPASFSLSKYKPAKRKKIRKTTHTGNSSLTTDKIPFQRFFSTKLLQLLKYFLRFYHMFFLFFILGQSLILLSLPTFHSFHL